jgi:UPF0042 nucleotide-binding protein
MVIGKVTLSSFGFKYGIPQSNFYFDVTFLPNPARMNGKNLFDDLDNEMYEYVKNSETTQELVLKIVDLIQYLVRFDNIKVGIGCNSGRHRSVVIVTEIAKTLQSRGIECMVIHRDTN